MGKSDENKDKLKIENDSFFVALANQELINRHGEAASQIIQAHKGMRVDSQGNLLEFKGRNLKDISNYKVNPKYAEQNIKQQAGFSAELIKEARDNKENILKGIDNRTRTTDGLGDTNNQVFDHVVVDKDGNIIEGSGSQSKFIGKYSTSKEIAKSSEKIVKKMLEKEWDKYEEVQLDVPTEQVELAKQFARDKAQEFHNEAQHQREIGNYEKAELLDKKADEYSKAEERLRDSKTSSKDAVEFRKNPKKETVIEVVKDAHNAGIDAAKQTFVISGVISSAQNIYGVVTGEKTLEEATSDTVKTVAVATGTGYLLGTGGSAIKAIMHTSSNEMLRRIGTTNAPAMVAAATLEIGKVLYSYAKGEIDEEELLIRLGEKGTGLVASAIGSSIGTVLIPIPIVGSVVGGMIGYTLSTIIYKCGLDILGTSVSDIERARIEAICDIAIKENERIKTELNVKYKYELDKRSKVFDDVLATFTSVENFNIDNMFKATSRLAEELNQSVEFSSFDEFDKFMEDDDTILSF